MNIQAPRDFIDRRQLVSALRALRRGDFTVRLPEEVDGVDGEIASIFNEVVSLNEEMTQEFERLSRVVGKEGKISQRGRVKNAQGGWDTAIRSVNELIEDMVQPTAEVSRVIGAVANPGSIYSGLRTLTRLALVEEVAGDPVAYRLTMDGESEYQRLREWSSRYLGRRAGGTDQWLRRYPSSLSYSPGS